MNTIFVNGLTIAFVRRGKGIPLVLLHGYPLDHTIWDDVSPLLEDTFDVIAPDLRGFGKSTTVDTPYTMDDFASDIAGLIDSLGIEKVAIAGHSMGGYVALAFARLYPARVRGLGMISSQAGTDSPDGKKGRYDTAAKVAKKGVGLVVEAMTPKLSADAQVQAFVRDLMGKQSPSAVIGALKAIGERQDSTALLSSLHFPIVILHGDADALIPIDRAREMKAAASHPKLIELTGVGHMSMMEDAKGMAEGLRLLGD